MFVRAKSKGIYFSFLAVSLIVSSYPLVLAQSVPSSTLTQGELTLTVAERQLITNKILANPRVAKTKNQRLRVLNLQVATSDKEDVAATSTRRLVKAIVFNYATGTASRFLVDADSGEVISEEVLRGRPQPSSEEIQEAVSIIQASPEHANLLQAGNIIEGGFAVDPPNNALPNNRYIQMQILSRDRKTLQRVVYVDLSTSKIALSSPSF